MFLNKPDFADEFSPQPVADLAGHSIPIQVQFLRVVNPNIKSRLTCDKSTHEIQEALKMASAVWESQAGIRLLYAIHDLEVSLETDLEFEEHLVEFSNPKKYLGPKEVSADLARILGHDSTVDAWVRANVVSIYCIGAFVGNNAVTQGNLIFVRTIQFRSSDLPMDNFRFARILAHEIGHSFHLGHPSKRFCLDACTRGECNLMCQQKVIPDPPHDPRFATHLNNKDIAWARADAAASFDVSSRESPVGQVCVGLVPFEKVSGSGRGMRVVLFSQPLAHDGVSCVYECVRVGLIVLTKWATKVRFQLARFKPVKIGLIAIKDDQLRLLAWNSFGNAEEENRDGSSLLDFSQVDFSWWTARRHIEADIVPKVKIFQGEYWGLIFSQDLVSVAMVRGGLGALVLSNRGVNSIPEFFLLVANQTVSCSLKEFDSVALSPKMNLDVEIVG